MRAGFIEAAWEGYRKHVLFDIDEEAVAIIRIAFYAGARAAVVVSEIGDEEIIADMAHEVKSFQLEIWNIAKEGRKTR